MDTLTGPMSRRVVISGLGPVSGLGIGIEPVWQALCEGCIAIRRIERFDPTGFDCQIGAEVKTFKINDFVPKSYRKATKVMSRDIAIAVAAASLAVQDARIVTKASDAAAGGADDAALSYPPSRMGVHIGAGLIAADLDELTAALVEARCDNGTDFDMHEWGSRGMNHLTPLWLLKYLPNMLACHVTIIHDAQGPSNTITCGEASSGLSIGESMRVIERGAADICLCGGVESKLNPMTFLRQEMAGRLNAADNDTPHRAVRPFCKTAAGTVIGEGGAILVLEALDTFMQRVKSNEMTNYAELVGFGASQSVNPPTRSLSPPMDDQGIAVAIRSALRDAAIGAEDVDMIIPSGLGLPGSDAAEFRVLQSVFGPHLDEVSLVLPKAMVGNCGAGSGALDIAIAAKALAEQTRPAVINCDQPLDGRDARSAVSGPLTFEHVLTFSSGQGGQNAALVLRRLRP